MGQALSRGTRFLPVALALGCSSSPPLDVGPRPVGVIVETELTYYDITAASLEEIRRGIRDEGPRSQGRRWGAVTKWELRYTYQTSRAGANSCELQRPRVRVRTTVMFPRWNPSAEPDSLLLEWWRQYNAGLAEHERGHARLAVQSAGEIVQALEGIHSSCVALETQAKDVFQRQMRSLNEKQAEYDRTTAHGATQIQAARRLHEP